MTQFELAIASLNLDQTLGCGQTFRWKSSPDGSWRGPLGSHTYEISWEADRHIVHTRSGGKASRRLVAEYFRAQDDVQGIQKVLGRDRVLKTGIRRMKGLRIVKMDEWECLASYILATYANIPRITKMIEALCNRFGERIDDEFSSFPSIGALREASEEELKDCGLGYRAGLLRRTCHILTEDDIRSMTRLGSADLRARLISLPGVGDKVADCVALFGFGRLEAFPIDVWMERALERLYGVSGSYRALREFATGRFGPFAGYAQEYLYFNERVLARTGACAFS